MNDKIISLPIGKAIDQTIGAPEIIWAIDFGKKEFFECEYRQTSASRIRKTPYWFVVVEAPTVDRLYIMLKKAEAELAKNIAVKAAMDRTRPI